MNFFKQHNTYFLKSLWLTALLFLPSCISFQEKQSIIVNMSYHEARKVIVESGWKPSEGMPAYEEIGAAAHYFRDLGYTEVSDCTGSGILLCTFYFQNKNGEYLKIGTAGEYPNPSFDLDTRVVSAAIRDDIN